MVLLDTYSDPTEARRVRVLLEGKGIPVLLERAGIRQDSQTVLFVCINSQLDDALTILRFPSHVPAQPVDVAQYRRDIAADDMKSASDYLLVRCLVGIGVCLALIALIHVASSA